MKKKRTLLGILCMFLLLTACNKKENIDNTSKQDTSKSTETSISESTNNANITYTISKYELGVVSIAYPIISSDDTSLEDNVNKINEIIYNDAISILDINDINEATDSIDIECSVFIDTNGDISILFFGDSFFELAAHPAKFVYTSNTNLYTASRCTLLDADIINNLTNNFTANETYKVCSESSALALEIEEYLDTYSTLELAKSFEYMDFSEDRTNPLSYSYKDELGTYVIIDIPTSIGQYATLQILSIGE